MNIIIVVVEVLRDFLMNWDKLLFEKLIIIVWEFCRFINKIGDKIGLFFFLRNRILYIIFNFLG